MTSSRFQVPPTSTGFTSASPQTSALSRSTICNLRWEAKPRRRLSGAQNGISAFSELEISCAAEVLVDRTHSLDLPSGLMATKARRLPSGDNAKLKGTNE